MNDIKFLSKYIIRFFIVLLVILIISFSVLFFVIANISVKSNYHEQLSTARKLVEKDSKDIHSEYSKETRIFLDKSNVWTMLLDENGKVVKDYNLPKDIDKQYKITDVVRFTRWYLEGYPVFTYVVDDKVFVLGFPKNSFDKLPGNYYNFSTYKNFGIGIFIIILTDVFILFLIYVYSKKKLLNEIKPITQGLHDLSENHIIDIEEKGNLLEIKKALNKTSKIIENNKKESEKWIRGISHDIRTPLTIIVGSNNVLKSKYNDEKSKTIEDNVLLIENILSNLNLTYSIKSNLYDLKKDTVNLKSLSRKIIVDILNSYEHIDIELETGEDEYIIKSNEIILERMIRNIILNSIKHNKKIDIKVCIKKILNDIVIEISDNGKITEDKVLELNNKDSYNRDGFGILVSKMIANLYNGEVFFEYNNPGLNTIIKFPTED
ncbi:sensor histidine kinase [Peptostreptococcus faecalis]|uniref:sensor histidine kinase n=1 Tax=Peptostreptococcus faecalis TaxID=2045015 RepID=UPI000C7E3906|nr:HAMP domain-containing sensor histidine kinase [Peptostreptococcus faecalis]